MRTVVGRDYVALADIFHAEVPRVFPGNAYYGCGLAPMHPCGEHGIHQNWKTGGRTQRGNPSHYRHQIARIVVPELGQLKCSYGEFMQNCRLVARSYMPQIMGLQIARVEKVERRLEL